MLKGILFPKCFIAYVYPEEWGSPAFCCEDCGDTFFLKSSYDLHRDRESVKITYFCQGCNSDVIFTNRCLLFSHIKSHGHTEKELNLSQVQMEPLPIHSIFENSITTNENSSIINNVVIKTEEMDLDEDQLNSSDVNILKLDDSNNETCQERVDVVENNISNNVIVSTTNSDDNSASCLLCFAKFKKQTLATIDTLKIRHFQKLDDSDDFIHTCVTCKRILPNKCALQAHQSLHTKKPPFICPECGLVFQSASLLQKHASLVCCHDSRTMYVKCIIDKCKTPCREQDLLKHFMSLHVKLLFKCLECHQLYDTTHELNLHSELVHRETLLQGFNIFECQFCQITFSKKDISDHISDHFKHAIKIKYYYLCPGCKCFFARCGHMKIHFETCVAYKKLNKYNTGKHLPSAKQPNKNSSNSNNSKMKMKTQQSKISDLKNIISNGISIKIVNRMEVNRDKKANNVTSNDNCIVKNEIKPKVKKTTETLENSSNKIRKRRRRFIQKRKKVIITPPSMGMTFSAPFSTGTFNCAKCSFSSTKSDIFQQHILSHRDPLTAYQCMECGLCFIAKTSFSIHLCIIHNIKDLDIYIENNNNCIVESDYESNKKPKTENTNVCNICQTEFDNNNELTKHFRSHGMAFLTKRKNSV